MLRYKHINLEVRTSFLKAFVSCSTWDLDLGKTRRPGWMHWRYALEKDYIISNEYIYLSHREKTEVRKKQLKKKSYKCDEEIKKKIKSVWSENGFIMNYECCWRKTVGKTGRRTSRRICIDSVQYDLEGCGLKRMAQKFIMTTSPDLQMNKNNTTTGIKTKVSVVYVTIILFIYAKYIHIWF